MKKIIIILLVGLGMSFSAQNQNCHENDTTKQFLTDSTEFCKKDSITPTQINVINENSQINVENNYYRYSRHYTYYDDIYYFPHYVIPLWYTPRPWYTPQTKVIFYKKEHRYNKKMNQHRNTNITDGSRDNRKPLMYDEQTRKSPQTRENQWENRSYLHKRPTYGEQIHRNRQNLPPKSSIENRLQIQQNKSQQHNITPPINRRVNRQEPIVELENWMMSDTYLEIN